MPDSYLLRTKSATLVLDPQPLRLAGWSFQDDALWKEVDAEESSWEIDKARLSLSRDHRPCKELPWHRSPKGINKTFHKEIRGQY